MRWAQVLLVALAYLVGSIPTSFIFARLRHGVDLRKTGSGNVGGSNLRSLEGAWATVLAGVADIVKGALPVWLGLRLGLGHSAALSAGAAVIIGHDWSLWLGFRGGRGVASTIGVLLVAFPYGCLWILVFLAMGALARQVGMAYFVAALGLTGLAAGLDRPPAVVALTIGLFALTVLKRLEANRRFRTGVSPIERHERRVLLSRLLLDRDQWRLEGLPGA